MGRIGGRLVVAVCIGLVLAGCLINVNPEPTMCTVLTRLRVQHDVTRVALETDARGNRRDAVQLAGQVEAEADYAFSLLETITDAEVRRGPAYEALSDAYVRIGQAVEAIQAPGENDPSFTEPALRRASESLRVAGEALTSC